MCLYVKGRYGNVRAKVAKKDITVYKIVSARDKHGDSLEGKDRFEKVHHYRSEYQDFKYELNETYENDNFPNRCTTGCSMGSEGIHSYSPKSHVLDNSYCYSDSTWASKVVVKCKIPKGTKYYVGEHNCYISQALYIGKPIKKAPKIK